MTSARIHSAAAVLILAASTAFAQSGPAAHTMPPNVGGGVARTNLDPTRADLTIPPPDMTFHLGDVQHGQKVFTIFWNPTTVPFPDGYQASINQFVQDLNDSSYYAIATQYYDWSGPISPYVTLGGTWLDTTNPFPGTALNFFDLLAEVNRAIAANGWPSDATTYFQVYTPSGITNLVTGICGLHYAWYPAFGQILFPDIGCFASAPYPNGQLVDGAIDVSAHEIVETLTDPRGLGWFYSGYTGEIGDLCNWNFGPRAADGSNVTLAGHNYLVQQLWSNASSSCAISYNNGGPPTAALLLGPNGTVNTSTPTYQWRPSIGASPATSYLLRVQNSSNLPVVQQWFSSSVCGSTTCEVTPNVPLVGDTYTWAVLAANAAGAAPWSSVSTFRPAVCDTAVTLTYTSGTIDLNFQLESSDPGTWNVWYLTSRAGSGNLWSTAVPALTPSRTVDVQLPGVPPVGQFGIITTLQTSTGSCVGWNFVNTDPGATSTGQDPGTRR